MSQSYLKEFLCQIKRHLIVNKVQKTEMLSLSWFTHNMMSKAQGAILEFASSAVFVWPCCGRALSNHTQHFEYTNRWNFISMKNFYCHKNFIRWPYSFNPNKNWSVGTSHALVSLQTSKMHPASLRWNCEQTKTPKVFQFFASSLTLLSLFCAKYSFL